MGREETEKRDAGIWEAWKSGTPVMQLSKQHEISAQNIYRILKKYKKGESDGHIRASSIVAQAGPGEAIDYEGIGRGIGALVKEKQAAYGDSFSKSVDVLSVMYPDVSRAKLSSMLTVVRVVDKLFRIATHPEGDAMGEDPWRDIAGYALLELGKRP